MKDLQVHKRKTTGAKGKLFIIAGPSGAGKTTIVSCLLLRCREKGIEIFPLVTYTTRAPRAHEKHGVDYFFVSIEVFDQLKVKDFFLEITKCGDAFYGTSQSILSDLQHGKNFIAVLDRDGVREFRKKYDNVIAFWINVLSIDILSKRLYGRHDLSSEAMKSRMYTASIEIEEEKVDAVCQFHICNDDLTITCGLIFDLIEAFL